MRKWFASALVLAAGCMWGTLGLFARQLSAAGFGPFETTLIRTGTASLFGAVCLLLYDRKLFRIRWQDTWCFAGTGIASMLLFSVFYFTGIRYASLAAASVLVYTAPIFVVLISLVLFHEKFTARKAAALAAAFAGCILVSGMGADQSITPKGFFLCLTAGFFFSLYSIFGKLASQQSYHPLTITFYSFLFGALGCTFIVDWSLMTSTACMDIRLIPWMAGTGIVTAFVPYVMYSAGLSAMESSKASILASTELVTEALIGVAVYKEPMSIALLFGLLLIMSAVVLLNLAPLRPAELPGVSKRSASPRLRNMTSQKKL